MNKNEFISEVAKRCNIPTYMIEEYFNVISNIIAEKLIIGENVELPKLGRFYMTKRKQRIGKNLFGDKERQLEECIYPSFKICQPLKTRVKKCYK